MRAEWKLACMACVLLIAVLVGCSGKPEEPTLKEHTQTLEIVIAALENVGLELFPNKIAKDWILSGVEPVRYTVGSPVEKSVRLEDVSVYIFQSEKHREQGLKDFQDQTAMYDMLYPRIYKTNNAMIFYWAHGDMNEPAKFTSQFENAVAKLQPVDIK